MLCQMIKNHMPKSVAQSIINKMRVTFILLFVFIIFEFVFSQSQNIVLFPNNPPCESSIKLALTYDHERKSIREVEFPEMWFFPSDHSNEKKPAILVIPGGGYGGLSYEREGIQVAKWLNDLGVSAFVLIHRLPSPVFGECQNQVPLIDAKRAMVLIRQNANRWNIDSSKVGVLGFSAGGHLAATLSTKYDFKTEQFPGALSNPSSKPDFAILVYPVITMFLPDTHYGSRKNLLGDNPSFDEIQLFSNEIHVDQNTPPTLLLHASDDKAVVVSNSVNYFMALQENNVPSAIHIWEQGGHGFGMHGAKGAIKSWPIITKDWLIQRGLIQQ